MLCPLHAVYKAKLLGKNGTPHGDAAVKVSTAVDADPEEYVKGFGYYSHTNEACRLVNAADKAKQLQEAHAQKQLAAGASNMAGSSSKGALVLSGMRGSLATIADATAKVAVPAFLTSGVWANNCVSGHMSV